MKKIYLLLSVSMLITFLTQAQDKSASSLSIGPDVVLPIGNFGTFYNIGIGGTAKYMYQLNEKMGLTATSGYLSFSGKTITMVTPNFPPTTVKMTTAHIIPLKFGFNYALTNALYAEPQLGVSFLNAGGNAIAGNSSTTGFTYAAVIGYRIKAIDLSMRYEGISAYGGYSFIGFRAAYNFGL